MIVRAAKIELWAASICALPTASLTARRAGAPSLEGPGAHWANKA